MRPLVSSVLGLALVLGLASVGCAAPEDSNVGGAQGAQAQSGDAAPIAATNGAPRVLEGVWAVRQVASPDELTIRLYELGGGDPAINGNFLKLAIEDKVWDLPSNILSVTSITSTGAGALRIVGEQQTIDGESGDVKSQPWQSDITYRLTNGDVASQLEVTTNQTRETVSANTDAGSKFLANVYKVVSAETDGLHARVFESGGGDPAMNGAKLHLAVMSFPDVAVFDLALDVNTVSKVEVDAKARTVTLLGSEDTMTKDGEIKNVPFRKTFAIGETGGVPTSVRSAR